MPGPSENSSCSSSIPGWGFLSLRMSQKAPFLNPNPLTHWSGPENIAQVRIVGESSWDLLDSGLTISAVTQEFIKACSLDVGPFGNLASGILGINGFGGVFSWPLGYIIIRVQVEGVWGYDKDQVALVIPDSTIFGSWVLLTLGTSTINQIINMIKESEIDELSASLNGLRIDQLLACCRAAHSVKSKTAANQTVDLTDLNKVIKMTKKEEIDIFSSKIIDGWTKPCSWETTCM